MGQEQSTAIDESTPPRRLDDRSLASIAKYIRDGKARKIVVMVRGHLATSSAVYMGCRPPLRPEMAW